MLRQCWQCCNTPNVSVVLLQICLRFLECVAVLFHHSILHCTGLTCNLGDVFFVCAAPMGSIGTTSAANAQQDDLTERLKALRGSMPNA